MEKHIDVNFDGYYINREIVPEKKGVYCVYRAIYNETQNAVTPNEVIYIGKASDQTVRERLANHEKYNDWVKKLKQGESLCYSYGSVSDTDIERAEAALINKHKPVCNTEYVYSFPYDTTYMTTQGCNALLSSEFTVIRH